jgi:hypothetical protein
VPKFTIFWLLVYFGGMIGSFINPLYGVLTYLFEYYLRPKLHWWGNPLPDWRWNFIIGTVALVAFLIRRPTLRQMPRLKNPASPWFVAMLCCMAVVTLWAVDPATSWDQTVAFGKLLIIYALMVGTVRSLGMFDSIMAMHIAGAGWWGWQTYLDPRRIGARLQYVGSGDTLNDNLAAAHLLTVLPILCVFALTSKDKRLRILAIATAPFIVNTFILCNSRGATVGLAAGFLMAVLAARSGLRVRMIGVAIAVTAMFYVLADPQFIERQQTITEDDAGAERIETWQGAGRLLLDHPFGVGGGGFEYLSPVYIPSVVEQHDGELRSVHNTYLLIATEWGLQGLFLYVGLLGTTFWILHRVRRRSHAADDFYYRSLALQVGLVSTLTAAAFSNRFLGESIYWLCGLAFALYRVQALELGSEATQPTVVVETVEPKYRPAAAAAS